MTVCRRFPVTGFAVNITPATAASTIRCTTTASRTLRGRWRSGSVRDGPIGPQRRPAAMDRIEHRVGPDDVQVGVLLPRETGKRQIFRSRRRPDGHCRLAQGPVGGGDDLRHVGGHGRGQDPFTRPRPAISAARSESSAVMPASSSTISARSAAAFRRDRRPWSRRSHRGREGRPGEARPGWLLCLPPATTRPRRDLEAARRTSARGCVDDRPAGPHPSRSLPRQDRQSGREATPERVVTGGIAARVSTSASPPSVRPSARLPQPRPGRPRRRRPRQRRAHPTSPPPS